MKTNKSLQIVLSVNAIFSGLSGLILIFFSHTISNFMGISNPYILLSIGFGLMLFSLSIIWIIRKGMTSKRVKSIIYQDWAWVLGSIALLLFRPFEITFEGNILIGVIASIVASFAIGQQISLRK